MPLRTSRILSFDNASGGSGQNETTANLELLRFENEGKKWRHKRSQNMIVYTIYLIVMTFSFQAHFRVHEGSSVVRALQTVVDVSSPSTNNVTNFGAMFDSIEALVGNLVVDTDYGGNELPAHLRGYTVGENRLLGIYLLQKRARRAPCEFLSSDHVGTGVYEPIFPNCLPADGTDPDLAPFTTSAGATFDNPLERSLGGKKWESSGFEAISTLQNRTVAVAQVARLKKNLWASPRETTRVSLFVIVYNGNVHMLCAMEVRFIKTVGGIVRVNRKIPHFNSGPPHVYFGAGGYFLFAVEVILFSALCAFSFKSLRVAASVFFALEKNPETGLRERLEFGRLMSIAVLLDLTIFSLFIFYALDWLRYAFLDSDAVSSAAARGYVSIQSDIEEQKRFVGLMELCNTFDKYGYLASFLIVASYLRTYRFFSFNLKLSIITDTIKRSAGDIINFIIVFCVSFLAFAMFGFLSYGRKGVPEFETYRQSLHTCFKMMLGEYHQDMLEFYGQEVGRAFFYYGFMLLCGIVLYNVFLAIILENYNRTWQAAQKKQAWRGQKYIHEVAYKGAARVARKTKEALDSATAATRRCCFDKKKSRRKEVSNTGIPVGLKRASFDTLSGKKSDTNQLPLRGSRMVSAPTLPSVKSAAENKLPQEPRQQKSASIFSSSASKRKLERKVSSSNIVNYLQQEYDKTGQVPSDEKILLEKGEAYLKEMKAFQARTEQSHEVKADAGEGALDVILEKAIERRDTRGESMDRGSKAFSHLRPVKEKREKRPTALKQPTSRDGLELLRQNSQRRLTKLTKGEIEKSSEALREVVVAENQTEVELL